MKITALKSGRFAHPVVSEPQIEIEDGKEYTVDTQIGTALIDCGWAEEVKKEVKKKTVDTAQAPEKPLKSRQKKKSKKDK
jgi:hypothetical protein